MKFLVLSLLAVSFSPQAQAEVITDIRFKAKVVSIKDSVATINYGGKNLKVPKASLPAEARKSGTNKEVEIALSEAQYKMMKMAYYLGN